MINVEKIIVLLLKSVSKRKFTQGSAKEGKALLAELVRLPNVHLAMGDEDRMFQLSSIDITSQLTWTKLFHLIRRGATPLEPLLA